MLRRHVHRLDLEPSDRTVLMVQLAVTFTRPGRTIHPDCRHDDLGALERFGG
ncbi:hypothetical protein I0C86_19615 [Plantactinospora sp. S1510]|uniref:Uncharacterized protein n=1 Tax=Plantactinospora alkalitolerans TaxID=2789879 RepID=A0ABS0GY56_9ACTN|nr:hypothetical protein [Plantactinospora alkalitolerans]MBF9131151.1 hypothetical protein [Plantactinospora alkalitolerans]